FIRGGTYGWNLHEKTFGCTSIPYTFYIILLKALGLGHVLSPIRILVLACVTCGIASLMVIYRTLVLLTKNNEWFTGPILKSILLLILLMPTFLSNLYSGMDTMLSLFANALMILAYLSWHQSPST